MICYFSHSRDDVYETRAQPTAAATFQAHAFEVKLFTRTRGGDSDLYAHTVVITTYVRLLKYGR